MGREVRRVPMGWQHPKQRDGQYQPLHDGDYLAVARAWMDRARAWDDGTHEDAAQYKAEHPFFWQWDGNPPDPEYYRPNWTSLGLEPDGYALYETVSEGTPVTPTFATKAELIEHLMRHGDGYGGGWDREAAEHMVEQEWAPTLIIRDGAVLLPRDQT